MSGVARNAAVGVLALLCGVSASGQQPAGQDGRLLDRNPALGGNGFNGSRGDPPLLGGNALANGDVGRGFSLRAATGVQSTSTFRANLGSGLLSNFRRDSVSVADAYSDMGGLTGRLYYDSSRSVFTPRLLGVQAPASPGVSADYASGFAGLGDRGRAQGGSPSPVGQALDWRVPTPSGGNPLTGQITGSPTGASGATPLPPPGSDRFPLLRPDDQPLGVAPSQAMRTSTATPTMTRIDARVDTRSLDVSSILSRNSAALGKPIDLLVRNGDNAPRADTDQRSDVSASAVGTNRPSLLTDANPNDRPVNSGMGLLTDRKENSASIPIDTTAMPGRDVFTDLQLANSLAANPNSRWFGDVKDLARRNPAVAGEIGDIAKMDSATFVNNVLKAPLRTFVGRSMSELNERLANAEGLLHMRKYYDADREYDRARMADPNNPLPLIGKGNALLAAGDYSGAARNLIAGMERYPELSKVQMDLGAIMGDGESIDIRRADLMKRLQQGEDPALRFLLGYLEYNSGRKDSGLQNLERAAQTSEPGSFIRAYPAAIKGTGVLPPPKLPPPPSGALSQVRPTRQSAGESGAGGNRP